MNGKVKHRYYLVERNSVGQWYAEQTFCAQSTQVATRAFMSQSHLVLIIYDMPLLKFIQTHCVKRNNFEQVRKLGEEISCR